MTTDYGREMRDRASAMTEAELRYAVDRLLAYLEVLPKGIAVSPEKIRTLLGEPDADGQFRFPLPSDLEEK